MPDYSPTKKKTVKKLSAATRWNRRIHRVLSITIATVLFISAITGIVLSWKKDIDIIQPPTSVGESADLENWLPTAALAERAIKARDSLSIEAGGIDRMDFRPSKGIVKVLFEQGYWEVQLDCTSGSVLSVERRYSDLFERIHDGSIISDLFKLGLMNLFGLGLLILIGTGLIMWYNPRRIRKLKS